MNLHLPDDWRRALEADLESDYFAELLRFIESERKEHGVYPSDADIFNALRLTPLNSVRVVIIGQDPYHNEGQAHGLSFSVPRGVARPPSLANIMRELAADMCCDEPQTGCLTPWAKQGVLMLNAVLTVREHQPNSHRGKGWERFTDSIIHSVNEKQTPTVFLMWGASAQRKAAMVDRNRHSVIASPHPSPLSAHTGFFGSRPFSRANEALIGQGLEPIDWRLQDSAEVPC